MTMTKTRLTLEDFLADGAPQHVADLLGTRPPEVWGNHCHSISLALVKGGILPEPGRVARGFCRGVASQHSWVVLGPDPYDREAVIIDPTLFYHEKRAPYFWVGYRRAGLHTPHGGEGTIWNYGRPTHQGGDTIKLDTTGLSDDALLFLDMVGPLDRAGWSTLLHAPVEGWPAAEITARANEHPKLRTIIPIDRVGMLTDHNPGGLYLPDKEV